MIKILITVHAFILPSHFLYSHFYVVTSTHTSILLQASNLSTKRCEEVLLFYTVYHFYSRPLPFLIRLYFFCIISALNSHINHVKLAFSVGVNSPVNGWFFAGEVMAVCHLDNAQVAQTAWRTCSQQCWDQRFDFDLEKVQKHRIYIQKTTYFYQFYSTSRIFGN